MIRDATQEDYAALAMLEEAVGNMHHAARPDIYKPAAFDKENYFELLENEFVSIFVYEDGTADTAREIVGFCHMSFFDYGEEHPAYKDVVVAHIDSMGVAEKAQRRGIGRALLEHARERALQSGAGRMQLAVCPFNEGARALYDSAGFRVMHTAMEMPL